jgi:lysophospholipid acyltransferase (LPLAT)-like uncharacterized protein
MSSDTRKAEVAARALAKSVGLPNTRGSIFAWVDEAGARIVVAADKRWLETHRSIPATYHGFRVTVEDPIDAAAHVG